MFKKKEKKNIERKRGFTLIEMLVSMTLFSFVITMALGALFMIMKANEKAKIVRTVVNNLNVALEGMSRELRMGSEYITSGSGSEITFKTKDNCDAGYKIEGGILKRMMNKKPTPIDSCSTDAPYIALTGNNVEIEQLRFIVTKGTNLQPRVFITLRAKIKNAPLTGADDPLVIQTLVTQRKIEE